MVVFPIKRYMPQKRRLDPYFTLNFTDKSFEYLYHGENDKGFNGEWPSNMAIKYRYRQLKTIHSIKVSQLNMLVLMVWFNYVTAVIHGLYR